MDNKLRADPVAMKGCVSESVGNVMLYGVAG